MGFDLPTEKQKRLKILLKKVSKLSISFRKNINDYQDYILCNDKEVEGLSERLLATLPKHTDGRYIVSLQYPHIFPFMAEAVSEKKGSAELQKAKGGFKAAMAEASAAIRDTHEKRLAAAVEKLERKLARRLEKARQNDD